MVKNCTQNRLVCSRCVREERSATQFTPLSCALHSTHGCLTKCVSRRRPECETNDNNLSFIFFSHHRYYNYNLRSPVPSCDAWRTTLFSILLLPNRQNIVRYYSIFIASAYTDTAVRVLRGYDNTVIFAPKNVARIIRTALTSRPQNQFPVARRMSRAQ